MSYLLRKQTDRQKRFYNPLRLLRIIIVMLAVTGSLCKFFLVTRSQFFCPVADTLPGGAGWPKFNQLEMVTTNPVW